MATNTQQHAPILLTERLKLTLFNMGKDIPFSTHLLNDFFSNEEASSRPWTDSKVKTYFEKTDSNWPEVGAHLPPPARYIIQLKSLSNTSSTDPGGDKIGMISYFYRSTSLPAEIFYVVLNSHSNQGIISEALKEAMRHWREDLGVQEISALVSATRGPSMRICEKLGLVRGGIALFVGFAEEPEELIAFILPGMKRFERPIVPFAAREILDREDPET